MVHCALEPIAARVENEEIFSARSKREDVFALLNAGVKFENVLQLYPRCEDIGREWVENCPTESVEGNQVIGVAARLLERSNSPLVSESFLGSFMKALQDDPPAEFRCPIMGTLIRFPVVLSSGYVVDKATALNEKGELRFSTCPFTRKQLVNMVYPMESLRQQLSSWKAGRLDVIMETLTKIMKVGSKEDIKTCLQVASSFLDDIGREVYPRWAREEHRLYVCQIEGAFASEETNLDDEAVAYEVVSMFQALWKSSQHHNCLESSFHEHLREMNLLERGSPPYRHLWIDAYGKIRHPVLDFGRHARLHLARRYLEFAKVNGDANLIQRAQSGVAHMLLTTASRYCVTCAGSSEVLGEYFRVAADNRDGCSHFLNRHGVSLLRYRFRHTGNAYWFIAKLDPDGDDAGDIDYYRTKAPTETRTPPTDVEWICKESRSAGGLPPVPIIRLKRDSTHDLDVFLAEEGLVTLSGVPGPNWTQCMDYSQCRDDETQGTSEVDRSSLDTGFSAQ
eukprot:GEMP01008580.1.p1 GENE.GEMP01008580.1~~GEMP01008580.1.p1  ORF type:complete len:508 (+),score=79.01 GEMP01008580.1:290-1813(+)